MFGATRLALRVGLVALPEGLTWRHVAGLACLGGMGFTMSLFIAALAFESSQLLEAAKLSTLLASLIAGLIGFLLLRRTPVATR